MTQKIKEFFTKKRCRRLLNNKGFSLLEVLVAVSIIGIISAIAIPQFNNYRNQAAKAASDTSASNIGRAFTNCMAIKEFGQCNSLSDIGISPPSGSRNAENPAQEANRTTKFCTHIHNGTAGGNNEFKVCVQMDSDGSFSKKYGGKLLSGKYCHYTLEDVDASNRCPSPHKGEHSTTKECTDANAATACASEGSVPGGQTGKCKLQAARGCKPVSTGGVCGSSGDCT